MTDFQVGDRVSVEGVVTCTEMDFDAIRETAMVQVKSGGEVSLYLSDLTLVERPKRKLRVGSVWEYNYIGKKAWIVGQRAGADLFVPLNGLGAALLRSQTNFDTDPQDWREVPVEELEAEANA